jgi:DNA-binding NarL/FixJ family response regulator
MQRVRVLITDDHPLFRLGIKTLVGRKFDIVGPVFNGRTLLEMAITLMPHIVILDSGTPVLGGLDAARYIKQLMPSVKLIVISTQSDPLYIQRALQLGISAYLLKSDEATELCVAMESVLHDHFYLSLGLDPNLITRAAADTRRSPAVQLTPRQKQVLQLIADGRRNEEIAAGLEITVKTVEFHRTCLMSKLGIHNIGCLTRFALEDGLVAPRSFRTRRLSICDR